MAKRIWRDAVASRLARRILVANLMGLGVLILGVFWTSGIRGNLIQARAGILRSEALLVRNIMEGTVDEDVDELDPAWVREIMRNLRLPEDARARIFDAQGNAIIGADSSALNAEIRVEELPPAGAQTRFRDLLGGFFGFGDQAEETGEALRREVEAALAGAEPTGEMFYALRADEDGDLIISVAAPIRLVERVRGVVVVETAEFGDVLEAERDAVMPFIFVAFAVTVISSALLTLFIARPVRILAIAADRVRALGPQRARIPDLSNRKDELGDLSSSLSTMTDELSKRIETIERFASDVAHEVKNPLTSIRSALETLPVAKNDEQRERLMSVMQHDVRRIDRLISDITSASRMDAEVARAPAEPLDLRHAITTIVSVYENVRPENAAAVAFEDFTDGAPVFISGVEGPLGHVFRNLIDNAISFSPPDGVVTVRLAGRYDVGGEPRISVVVEDEGPGVPPDKLERIFERFYTERPKGDPFGSHSGLGLSICKQIVEAMRGRIWTENREGPNGEIIGARFIVMFPLRA